VIYNRPGGNVTIAVARSGTEYWKISVTDSGPGIPADCISRLFVPFERLGQKEGGTAGGTGLGLALCQRLVKALDGKIGVASTVGLGSTFWVEIPALVSIHQSTSIQVNLQESSEPVTQPIPMQKTILYVEDDLANYHLLERIISSRKDLRLVSAPEGRTAFEKIRQHQPNLVLLDLNLPDMPGEQLLERLKADAQTSEIPVIIVTGEVMTDRANNLSKIGAANVLAKPYRIQELFQMLDMHLV
jgi:CheY-like chemotaxis protein